MVEERFKKDASAKKRHEGYWQTAIEIDIDARKIKLKTNRGAVYDANYDNWTAKLKDVDVKVLLEKGERVRVFYNSKTHTVHGVWHEKPLDKGVAKGTEEVMRRKPQKKVLVFGDRPPSQIGEEAKIEVLPTESGRWKYIVHAWQIKKIEYEDYHKLRRVQYYDVVPVSVESAKEYRTEKEALKEGIIRARDFIVEHVLGRDFSMPLPAEDNFSLLGRRWLRNLEDMYQEYLGEEVHFKDAPAGVRYVDNIPANHGAWLLTQDRAVGMIVGVKPSNIKTLKPLLTGRKIMINIAFDPKKPFIKIGKGVYNVYHIASVIETLKYKRSFLKSNGEFKEDIIGKGVALPVIETKGEVMIIDLGNRAIVLSQSTGVDGKLIQDTKIMDKEKVVEEEEQKVQEQPPREEEVEENEEEEMGI